MPNDSNDKSYGSCVMLEMRDVTLGDSTSM